MFMISPKVPNIHESKKSVPLVSRYSTTFPTFSHVFPIIFAGFQQFTRWEIHLEEMQRMYRMWSSLRRWMVRD
jgi:hypothetical protein